ncbi:hypothetical protein V5799_033766 [Amblyomma americanum]|uniref:DDE-1 domain-containing protein n=1 Tax=Amblyomma americanum TaxID=6943 RepID=A0AAQ4DMD7_AMBAM
MDRRFRAEKRKVLMVVDNCSAHCKVSGLEWIKLVFLPPITTAALQPMDQGIIQHIKCKYRKHVLQRMLLCMEAGKKYDLTLLSALNILAHEWANTPTAVIANCFRHSGFVQPNCGVGELPTEAADATTDDDSCFDSVLPPAVRLADYVSIDDGVAIAGQLTEDEIIQEVTGADNDDSSEDDDCEHLPQTPKRTAALLSSRGELVREVPRHVQVPALSRSIYVKTGAEGSLMEVLGHGTPVPARWQQAVARVDGESSAVLEVYEGGDGGQDATLLARICMDSLEEESKLVASLSIRSDGSVHISCTDKHKSLTESVTLDAATTTAAESDSSGS